MRKVLLLLLCTLLLCTPAPLFACGGFFCSIFPVNQVSESILFVKGEGTITTHVQIQYTGEAEDFAWVLPAPSLPSLDVSHNLIFQQLQFATQPFFQLDFEEDSECFFFPPFVRFLDAEVAASSDVEVISEDQVGPYNTAIITSDDPDAVVTWLRDNDYDVSGLGASLIAPYVQEGFYFVALRLAKDKDTGDIQPLALTYEAEMPGIPIRLTAVATEADLGVTAWVLGQNRAIPDNYLHMEINEARIDWLNGGFNYAEVVTEAVNDAGGNAFTTDYAGSSDIMLDRIYREGQYDLISLRSTIDPAEYLDALLRQGFPRDNQMQSLIRRHIPLPQAVIDEGALQVLYRGDVEAMERDRENGTLLANIEQSFYNDISAYAEWTGDLIFDPNAFTDDVDAVIVTPLQEAQDVFDGTPYLTRLFTTLSADEMTLDPMFNFNPDLEDVDNVRRATARCECPEGVPPEEVNPEDKVLVITLSDGREIRIQGQPGPIPLPFEPPFLPSASVVQRLNTSGPPETVQTLTAITSDFNDDGATTIDDLPDFANAFGKASPRFDLDNDGMIGFGDLLIFARAIGEG